MPEIHPRKIKIRRHTWTLVTHDMPDDGLCEYLARSPRKHIWIHPAMTGERMLDVLVHECLHCALPDIDEVVISDTASSIAKILWDLGYRCEWDEES